MPFLLHVGPPLAAWGDGWVCLHGETSPFGNAKHQNEIACANLRRCEVLQGERPVSVHSVLPKEADPPAFRCHFHAYCPRKAQ